MAESLLPKVWLDFEKYQINENRGYKVVPRTFSSSSCKESESDPAQLSPKLLARPAVFTQPELSGVLLGIQTSRLRTGGLWPLQRPKAQVEGGLLLLAPRAHGWPLGL